MKDFITIGTLGTLSSSHTGFIGLQITVLSAITVTELQRYVVAGNTKSHILKIVDEKNRTIAQGTVTTLGKTGFASVAIKPVVLSPNTIYYILSQETKGGDKWHHFTSVTGDPVATVGKPSYTNYESVVVVTAGVQGNCYGPVGFKFQPTCAPVIVPDPPVEPPVPSGPSEEEFVGPFPSWVTAGQDLQAAFDQIGNEGSQSSVVFIPAGTYTITKTLKLNNKTNISIIGADPATTKIVWAGPAGGRMIEINGTSYSRFNRITWDGKGIATIAINQSWDGVIEHFDTGNEYSDNVFQDVDYGIYGGHSGFGFAETTINRCKFLRNRIAGISCGNFNALDCWVWSSYFEDCGIGITNAFGAGNFKVYGSVFKGSKVADITIHNTSEFAFRDNYSINSKMFLHAAFTGNPCSTTLQGNVILDPIDDLCIKIENQGPVTFIDNTIRSRPGAVGPVVSNPSWPNSTFFSLKNTFTVENPLQVSWSIVDDNPTASLSGLKEPVLPGTPKKTTKTIREVPAGASTFVIQGLINQGGIVHFPHGNYSITETLTIPANSSVQIVGDGHGDRKPTRLIWAGTTGPLLKVIGPSKAILRDISLRGEHLVTNILLTNSTGGRVYTDQIQDHSNQVNLLIGGDVSVLCTNSQFSSSPKSVQVIKGTAILYAGAQSGNVLSYELNGGTILIRDVWYESNLTGTCLDMTKGNFYQDGCRTISPPVMPAPQFKIVDLVGKAVFSGSYISDKINISGSGQGKLLGLSNTTENATYIVNTSDADVQSFNIRAVDPDRNNSGSGSYTADNIGSYSAPYTHVPDMLSLLRATHVPVIGSLPAGVTDFRMHRVWLSNGINGLQIE